MTLQEFSVSFDILYNNISSNQAPGLTEYEKSVFLTQAQESVILDLYKGTAGDSFESTEEITRYLNTLVKTFTPEEVNEVTSNPIFKDKTYEVDLSNITDDILQFILYQSAQIIIGTEPNDETRDVLVVPTTLDRVYKETQNPFKGPNKNRILCLYSENKIQLISKYPVSSFYLKYLKMPYPIILSEAIDGDLEINEQTESKELEVPQSVHRTILLRAIQLAQIAWKTN